MPLNYQHRQRIINKRNALYIGLFAYYKLDDGSDSSGNGRHLVNNGGVTFGAQKVNGGATFNGTTMRLSDANAARWNAFTSSSWTVTGWFYADSLGLFRILLGRYWGAFPFVVLSESGGTLALRWRNTTPTESKATVGSVPTTTWTYFRAEWDAANSKIMLSINNGTPVEAATSGSPEVGDSGFAIGDRVEAAANPWNGRADEIKMWTRLLSTEEKARDYNAGNGLAL